jgi:hypothetical protein
MSPKGVQRFWDDDMHKKAEARRTPRLNAMPL